MTEFEDIRNSVITDCVWIVEKLYFKSFPEGLAGNNANELRIKQVFYDMYLAGITLLKDWHQSIIVNHKLKDSGILDNYSPGQAGHEVEGLFYSYIIM